MGDEEKYLYLFVIFLSCFIYKLCCMLHIGLTLPSQIALLDLQNYLKASVILIRSLYLDKECKFIKLLQANFIQGCSDPGHGN